MHLPREQRLERRVELFPNVFAQYRRAELDRVFDSAQEVRVAQLDEPQPARRLLVLDPLARLTLSDRLTVKVLGSPYVRTQVREKIGTRA